MQSAWTLCPYKMYGQVVHRRIITRRRPERPRYLLISSSREITRKAKQGRERVGFGGLALLGLVALISIVLIMPLGHAAAVIYTDQPDYHPEQMVTIYGSGFTPGANITVSVTRPDGTVNTCADNPTRLSPCPLNADSTGSFVTYYQLDGITGAYSVVATDGTSIASTAFTDAVSINILGTDGSQHSSQTNEENLGYIGPGTLDKFISIKANGLGTGNTLSWNLVYVASAENDSVLFPLTTLSPSSGTLTKSSNTVSVEAKIATSSLAAGTYRGELEATGTGVSPTPTPGFYFFRFIVDKTAPVITPSISPSPNAYGWNNGNVTVTWSVSDPESGILSSSGCGSTTLTSETAGTTITCSATNGAGMSSSASVTIRIDKTRPVVTGSASPGPNANGWSNGPVTVSFTCSDTLSGVGSTTGPTTLTGEGASQSATGSCSDKAGNTASTTVGGINIDLTPPSITGSKTPTANSFGWNNSPVSVSFTCSDSLSGVASVSGPSTVSSEGSGQSVTGTCTDKAGNSASTTVGSINIDLTPPTLTGSRSPSANSNGWNNGNVTVTFTCTDSLSGMNVSPLSPQVVSSEGSSQSVAGTCIDKAGNSASATINGINIDKTAPSLTGSRTPAPNSNGWNNVPVTVTFSCSDTLSGVSSSSSPTTLSTDGAAQFVTGICTDKAGNSVSSTVGGINIDQTPPSLTGSASPSANAYGWNNGPVTVAFTCTDSLSGVATGPTSPQVVSTEGAGQSRTSTCLDKAGNSASATVSNINIDLTAPTIIGSRSVPPNANGWNNLTVTVSFSCSDILSGTLYVSGPTTLGQGSGQSVTGTCTDKAGNLASAAVGPVNIDLTPPTITGSASPAPNANGWNNGSVTVTFTCGDALSGVASCNSPALLSTESAGQTVTGAATDLAGNSASFTVSGVNIDKTPPVITGSASPGPNAFGWNNGPVTVSFTCTDALSGVSSSPSSTTLSTDGAGQSITGTCTDKAGNSASAIVSGINIDQTLPVLTGSRSPSANSNGWNSADVTVSFICADALSGVNVGPVSPQVVSAEGAGQSRSATCTDKAGNVVFATVGGINIDKTPPSIFSSRTAPNAYDWNNGPVTVAFTCSDTLSGVAAGPLTPQVVSTEGASQSRTATCTDEAGNSASVTVGDINVDLTDPTITGSRSIPPNPNGWNNASVTVNFSCSDALSGIGSLSGPTILGEGAGQSVTGTCVDKAGNSASAIVGPVNVDITPPTITGSRTPSSNAYGWNNVSVTVSFSCSDALSGVASLSGPTALREGAGQSVTGACADKAGNVASATIGPINIDLTLPTISGSRSPGPNANGWNNGNVTVSFSCADSLSGVAFCSALTTLSGEGAVQSVIGSVTDIAGNTASFTVGNINIDKTSPSISSSRTPANALGWNNGPVTVSFSCTDALSGVYSVSNSTVLNAEGAGQSVTGICADLAGNSASSTVGEINIDLTPPIITSSRSVVPNVNGWNDVPVTVSFICSDALSGVFSVSSPSTVGEGAARSITGTCVDLAGNSANATESGISVDLTPPVITSSRSVAPNTNGWNNIPVTVTFSCSDSLSGVDSFSSPVTLNEGAGQSVTGTCVDKAGNLATTTENNINIDLTAPTITGSRSPDANIFGWSNVDVTVSFQCFDSLSGVASSPSPTILTAESAAQSVTGTCLDQAGNSASTTVGGINIDKTPPNILGSRTPAPNPNGWNNVDITVSFTCTDSLSGVNMGPVTPQVVSSEGAGQSRSATCTDKAGNSASAMVGSISIDKTLPVITASRSPVPNSFGWNNGPVTVTFTCLDSLSGVNTVPLSPQTISTEGSGQARSATCTDKAGNTASASLGNINIDLTSPQISGNTSVPPNSNGWNNVRVAVAFTCTDALSGVNASSGPTTLGEGAGQSVTGTCSDKAGNSASTTLGNINIDLTPPVLSGSRTPLANANGWNNGPNTVSFTCADNLSGVDAVSPSSIIAVEVQNFYVTGSCTDKAGNTDTTSVGPLNIDLTPPTIVGSRSPSPNGFGWNNVDVTVSFTCIDSLSGVAIVPVTPQVVSAEGASQSRSATCTDKAGNSASALVSGISIDKTPPILVGSRSPSANTFGWNNVGVTVSFTCTDALSGVDSYSGPTTLIGEGSGQTVTGNCVDKAGNTASATVGSINIDLTAPVITGSRTPANAFGWNNGSVTVSFACSDALAGVDSYSAPTTLSSEGAGQSVTGSCVDKAGNTASATVGSINIDLTAPVITGSRTPANAFGWNNRPVTVSFTCSDSLSGVATTPVSPQTVSTEGAGQSRSANCTDKAGNTASTTLGNINVDLTPPLLSGSRVPLANGNGWNNVNVVVSFTCSDNLSGIDISPVTPQTVSSEGAGQSRTGSCVDKAGNSVSLTIGGINIDKTAPTITGARSPLANALGWNNASVTATFACSDSLSGVASYTGPTTLSAEGAAQSVPGSCTDKAGNTASTTVGNISIDKTPPQTSVTVGSPSSVSGGSIQVSLSTTFTLGCTDNLSGCYQTKYGIDDPTTPYPYTGPFKVPSKGTHTIYYKSTDEALNAEASKSLTVAVGGTKITYSGGTQAEYSDPTTVRALLVEMASQQPISSEVVFFTVGTQSTSAVTNSTGFSSSSLILSQTAGNYQVTAYFAGDTNFQPASMSVPFTILKEDAVVTYTGQTVLVTTASSFTLQALVAVDGGTGPYGPFGGNLMSARVIFNVYTTTLTPSLMGTFPANVSLVNGPFGTASVTLSCKPGSGNPPSSISCSGMSLSEGAYDVQVQVDPANAYFTSPISDGTFSVYVPTGQFVTGGGWVADSSSTNPKQQANFGFAVRFNKNGQIQGQSVYIYRATCLAPGPIGDLCDIMIKSNAWIGLGFYTQTVNGVTQPCSNFQAKANVQEADTLTGTLYSVQGNNQMTVYACQGNSNSSPVGTYSMQDLSQSGTLFHATPGYPTGVVLGGGSTVVHNNQYTPTISLSPSSCSPGATVTVSGTGFAPLATVKIMIGSTVLATTTTDSTGSFSTTFMAPNITGTYTVTASDGTNSAWAKLTVT